MADTTIIPFSCPWCGAMQQHGVHKGAVLEVICDGGLTGILFRNTKLHNWCKKPIRLEIDKKGNLKSATKIIDTEKRPPVTIGTVYGNVSFGDNATMTAIYNETVKAISDAKHVDEEKKTQAKSILEHVKNYAPPFLPFIADVLKKTLGL